MMPAPYVWLTCSLIFFLLWLIVFAYVPRDRAKMWKASFAAMSFGLTEPLFVPRYWNPPSLFDLAQTTHFDLERA
jgi:hypothetical protein